MNSTGAAILHDPHSCRHIVYLYTGEEQVREAVGLYAGAGLRNGEGVILIMTAGHRDPIRVRIAADGLDPEALERSGRLVCITAEETLSRLMVNGSLHEGRFRSIIGRLIQGARSAGNGTVRVFGEMVSELRGTDMEATVRLEEMWNDVVEEHAIALLCTYALTRPGDRVPCSLINLHSHEIEDGLDRVDAA